MDTTEDLDAAVHAARAATHDLLGTLVAHQMVPGILNLRLVPHWPAAVRAAYLCWENRINDITRILARRRGIEPGARMSEEDTTALIIRACVLGLELDD